MKIVTTLSKMKMILIGFFLVLLFSPLNSSAKKIKFNISTIVPAAEGYVKVKSDSNKNYHVKISVNNLAEIERMEKTKLTYVVWMETDQGETENLGQLVSSTALFSSKLQATMETVSSYQPVKVFITTESEINVQYPSRQVVLTTDRF
ncbi:hypothetical protein [Sunxiuqinia sp. sy24]|uniref:hypothetical protein n=1 Tax=Sunxiuqinia sp. sy24 TaxID=3461495 RepID=UPI004045BA46